MKLSMQFPATVDDLAQFVDAARLLVAADVLIVIEGDQLGSGFEDSAEMVVYLPGSRLLPVAPVFTPPPDMSHAHVNTTVVTTATPKP